MSVICNEFVLLSVQILLGLPLEIVHGPFRIGAVYVAGVLTGSLARDSTQRSKYSRSRIVK